MKTPELTICKDRIIVNFVETPSLKDSAIESANLLDMDYAVTEATVELYGSDEQLFRCLYELTLWADTLLIE